MEQTTLYPLIDQASDSLERIMISAISSLEQHLDLETDPMKIAVIGKSIIESYERLQKIKAQSMNESKQSSSGVFESVMKQLSSTPKLADKCVKHTRLKNILSQAEEFKIKDEENEQDD